MQNNNKKIHLFLFLIVCAVFIWSVIKPERYGIWFIEVLPAVIVLLILILTYNKFRFSVLSYLIVAILVIMTFIGGHYTYSDVPVFSWLKDTFDLSRNHYDRFGHFLKGFFSIVIREMLLRKTPLKKGAWLVGIVLSISLAISAVYEIIEWISTLFKPGGNVSKEFLGMQGDMWDPQWDMALTLVGSIVALLLLSKVHDKFLRNDK